MVEDPADDEAPLVAGLLDGEAEKAAAVMKQIRQAERQIARMENDEKAEAEAVELYRILRLPDIRDRILATGNEPAPTTPEEFGAFIKAEVSKWIRVLQASNTQVT